MLRFTGILAFTLAFALPVGAQGKKRPAPSGKYVNRELGLTFSGVYGWESKFSQGAGAWNELASYSDQQLDAKVVLYVRNNIFKSMDEMRAALKREFSFAGEPTTDRFSYKEIAAKDVAMKRGLKLKGVEVEGFVTRVTDEGKKREHFMVVRTYYGRNRLFRVHCTARRSRAKRVRDRFEIAMASLAVTGGTEAAPEGTPFTSQRGRYSCLVPSGFTLFLPPSNSKTDMKFSAGRTGIAVSIYSYEFDGEIVDHRDVLDDYYNDALELEEDDVKLFGGMGFQGVLTRGDKITLIAGTVRQGRAYRVHTSTSKSKLEEAKRIHGQFVKALRIGRR